MASNQALPLNGPTEKPAHQVALEADDQQQHRQERHDRARKRDVDAADILRLRRDADLGKVAAYAYSSAVFATGDPRAMTLASSGERAQPGDESAWREGRLELGAGLGSLR